MLRRKVLSGGVLLFWTGLEGLAWHTARPYIAFTISPTQGHCFKNLYTMEPNGGDFFFCCPSVIYTNIFFLQFGALLWAPMISNKLNKPPLPRMNFNNIRELAIKVHSSLLGCRNWPRARAGSGFLRITNLPYWSYVAAGQECSVEEFAVLALSELSHLKFHWISALNIVIPLISVFFTSSNTVMRKSRPCGFNFSYVVIVKLDKINE